MRAGVFYQVLDKRSESAKAGGVSGFAFEVEQVSAIILNRLWTSEFKS